MCSLRNGGSVGVKVHVLPVGALVVEQGPHLAVDVHDGDGRDDDHAKEHQVKDVLDGKEVGRASSPVSTIV